MSEAHEPDPATLELKADALPPAPGSDTLHLNEEGPRPPRLPASEQTLPEARLAPPGPDGTLKQPSVYDPAATVGLPPPNKVQPQPPAAEAPFAGTLDYAPAAVDPNATLDAAPAGVGKSFLGDPEPGEPGMPAVPGYRILKELGRGGMGVVYQARQRGLNRLVALKMILSGAHAGAAYVARFRLEAEACAHLQHPNIVQIYEVNEHDGLPYFSLEFVEGGSLAQKIGRKPQSAAAAATTVELIARAMAYAHQHNIIHRDLKPVNILLTRDGIPKVTDFGLAKNIDSDSSQTKSGTLMGTPSYMAPEQARGEIHQVGPLADVYSLGAILYEMITGRPPFLGATVLDTLEQVRKQEPVPPGRLVAKVPVDLETICLKCLQKEPAKRYGSALALADDLRCFLEGRPIQARPVGNLERAWRWCRRNPRVAALTAAVAVLLVAVAGTSTYAAARLAHEKTETERARNRAVELADAEKAARAKADQNAEEARQAQEVANEQRSLAVKALGNLLVNVQNQLASRPGMQDLRNTLLTNALKDLGEVSGSARTSGLADRGTAIAHMKIGEIFQQLLKTAEAEREFRRGHEIVAQLAAAAPHSDKAQGNLAVTWTRLGDMCLIVRSDPAAALDHYRKGLAIREDLLANPRPSPELRPVDVDLGLADSHDKIGMTFLRLGDPAAASDHLRKASGLREKAAAAVTETPEVAQARATNLDQLGKVLTSLRQPDRAHALYDKSLQIRQALAKADPASVLLKQDLVTAYVNRGDLDLFTGRPADALRDYEESVKVARELTAQDPSALTYKGLLANAHYRAATAVLRLRGAAAAAPLYRESLKLREELVQKNPVPSRYSSLMLVTARCGNHERASELAAKLPAASQPSSTLYYQVACCYALCVTAAPDPGVRDCYGWHALEALEQAVALGFKDPVQLEVDPDLDPIRDRPAFAAVLARVTETSPKR